MTLFLTILLFFSTNSQAGRYVIPADDEVLVKYNTTPQVNALEPNDIRILVWNMYKGGMIEWSEDFKKLTADKDILLLQEGSGSNIMLLAFQDLKWMEFYFATSFIDNKNGAIGTGVVTAANVGSEQTQWQRSHYREPVIKTPKMTLFTKYSIKGSAKKLLVGNIHGVNFVRAYKLRHMLDKAAELIKKHNGPVVFGGDFNTWTQTKINNMNAVFKKLGMKAIKFKDARYLKRFRGKILDHVWVRGVEIIKATVPQVEGSDHNPMSLKLRIN